MGFPLLPQLSSAAELFIINLVAHHDPQPDAKFTRRCDPCLAHSFLDELATVEPFQFSVFLYCMHHRFRPQIAQQRVALLGHLSQPLPLAAGVFARDHPDVARYLVTVQTSTGLGIYVQSASPSTSTVKIQNSTVRGIQKNGITGNEVGTTVTITANSVVGAGPTTTA